MTTSPLREPTLYVLAALAADDLHGYGIIKSVEALSDGRLRLRAGTLYGALGRLEDEGLIERSEVSQERGPERQSYRITGSGRAALAAEVERLEWNARMARGQLRVAEA